MKIALVDIDGCAVQDGKLNPAMIDTLKKGGYDHIMLFTQRNTFLQIGQITRAYSMAESIPTDKTIVSTVDAVQGLNEALGRPVSVSTTVDQFFGKPGEYFEHTLAPFEQKVKSEAHRARVKSEAMDDYNVSPFNQQIAQETQMMREAMGITDERKQMSDLIPQGKVGQFRHLSEHLESLGSDLEIDYFDDSISNLDEFLSEDLPNRPNLHLVSGMHVAPLAAFDTKYAPRGRELDVQIVQAKAKYIDRGYSPEVSTLLAKYATELNQTIDKISSGELDTPIQQAQFRMQDLFRVTAFLKGQQLGEDDIRRVRQYALREKDMSLLKAVYSAEYGSPKGTMIAQCMMRLNEEIQSSGVSNSETIHLLEKAIQVLKQTNELTINLPLDDLNQLRVILPEIDISALSPKETETIKDTNRQYKLQVQQRVGEHAPETQPKDTHQTDFQNKH